jgi:hypothetical protein
MTAVSAKSKQAKTSLIKANQYVWYHEERKRHHRSVLGVEPVTAVRAYLGSWTKISDPYDLVIFKKARKNSSRSSISQEGILKSHPSFTSLLQNNLLRQTIFFTFTIRQETKE